MEGTVKSGSAFVVRTCELKYISFLVKATLSRDFRPFFILSKYSTWATYKEANMGRIEEL